MQAVKRLNQFISTEAIQSTFSDLHGIKLEINNNRISKEKTQICGNETKGLISFGGADRNLSSLFLVPFGFNFSTSLAKIWQIHQLTVLHALGHNPLLHLLFFPPQTFCGRI